MRGVLGLKRRKPSWFGLPVMMKLTLSTPHHVLKNIGKGPLTRPNNFMMIPQIQRFGYPQGVDPNECTLITSFTSSERDQWMRSKCINIKIPNHAYAWLKVILTLLGDRCIVSLTSPTVMWGLRYHNSLFSRFRASDGPRGHISQVRMRRI
jgi:hypothetical protein